MSNFKKTSGGVEFTPTPSRIGLAEQDKCICLNQDKTLSNLQQRIAFLYGLPTKLWTTLEAEKDEEQTKSMFEITL